MLRVFIGLLQFNQEPRIMASNAAINRVKHK